MSVTRRDYYEVLGVVRTADGAEIKKAYRKVAMECHPDRCPGDKVAEDRFKEASEAYEVLSDDDKRAHYDRFGHEGMRQAGFQGFGGVDEIFDHFSSLFGDLFGGRGGRGGRGPGQQRGADARVDLRLSFAEAAFGATRELSVERRVPCEGCSGSGGKDGSKAERCGTCGGRGQVLHSQGFFMIGTTCPQCRGEGSTVKDPCTQCRGSGLKAKKETLSITVPAGVDDGQMMRVAGKGEAAPRGGACGNLFVLLHVEPDERFRRDGQDIYTEIHVPFTTATLGGSVTIPTIEASAEGTAELDIEAGTQPGTVIVRRGQGLVRPGGGGRGNQMVEVQIAVPKKLTDRQRELLNELATEQGDTICERRGLFGKKKKKSS